MEASGHRAGHAYAAIRSGMLTLAATEKDMLLINDRVWDECWRKPRKPKDLEKLNRSRPKWYGDLD